MDYGHIHTHNGIQLNHYLVVDDDNASDVSTTRSVTTRNKVRLFRLNTEGYMLATNRYAFFSIEL